MIEWDTSCKDWEQRVVEGRSLIPFAPMFPAEADEALDVMSALRIVDAPGSPTIGESCRPWVFDFTRALFGCYDPEMGRRAITEFFLCVSKKNAKSTIAASIMLTALIRNWRQSAEFLILAPTIEIANNSFYPARDMVRHDDELSDLMLVQDHYRTITHRGTGSTLKVVAADNETVGGKKATGVLIDELWLFGKRPNAENMLREATGGLASRPEGFTIYLSTQSDEPPAGVFAQKLQYARDVRDGKVVDKRFLPVLYEFPDAMVKAGNLDKDPSKFFITNPNLGVSVDAEFLAHEVKKAQNAGAESMRGFLAKHLNVEIGLALRSDRWAGADFWEACEEPGLTLDSLLARSEVAVVGIDGGGLDDLLGLTIIGRERGTRTWLLWAHAWAHPIVLERRKEIAAALRDFEKDGDLTIVQKPGDDVVELADIVCRIRDLKLLPEKLAIGVDAAGIGDIVNELTSPGRDLDMEQIIAISQGWKLSGAIKSTERILAGKELRHGGSRLMNWCVGNARIVPQGNALTITKQASGTAKIDPLMSTFDAVTLMALNPSAAKKRSYQLFTA
jgi:phage terminase large subunit-like protein